MDLAFPTEDSDGTLHNWTASGSCQKHRASGLASQRERQVTDSIPCPACKGEIRITDAFCETCGVKVTPDQKRVLRDRLEACGGDVSAELKRRHSAQQGTLVLAVPFASEDPSPGGEVNGEFS
jgi:DnaJ-class molecular chaperone